jgi:hypothetical protein
MMNRTNVMFVILQMKPGGAEKVVYEIMSALDKDCYVTSIAWFKDFEMVDQFKKVTDSLHFIPKEKRVSINAMMKLA